MSANEAGGRAEDLARQARSRDDPWLSEVLGGFAERHADTMTPVQLDSFADLLAQPDADIRDWVTGKRTPPEELGVPALEMIMDDRRAQGGSAP